MFEKHHAAVRLKQLLSTEDPEKDVRAGAFLFHACVTGKAPTFQFAGEEGFGLHQNTLKKAVFEAEVLKWIVRGPNYVFTLTIEGRAALGALMERFEVLHLRLPKPWEK